VTDATVAKYVKSETFVREACERFAFLVDAHGFVGPVAEDYRLLYTSAAFSVEVLYDDRDGRVITIVDATVGRRNPRAGLQCLYVEAGLGPAQQVRDIVRTERSLESALSSQASALDRLVPVLGGDKGSTLLLACNGR
jgi:hypothetical protein